MMDSDRTTAQRKMATRKRIPTPYKYGANFVRDAAVDTSEKARNGDRDAAKEILQEFVLSIDDQGKGSANIHWEYMRYLADAFQKIIEGSDAADALGIRNNKPGPRKHSKTTHDKKALGAVYWFLLRSGFKPEKANSALVSKTRADRRTIQRAKDAGAKEGYQYPSLIPDDLLRDHCKPYVATLEEILTQRSPIQVVLRDLCQVDLEQVRKTVARRPALPRKRASSLRHK